MKTKCFNLLFFLITSNLVLSQCSWNSHLDLGVDFVGSDDIYNYTDKELLMTNHFCSNLTVVSGAIRFSKGGDLIGGYSQSTGWIPGGSGFYISDGTFNYPIHPSLMDFIYNSDNNTVDVRALINKIKSMPVLMDPNGHSLPIILGLGSQGTVNVPPILSFANGQYFDICYYRRYSSGGSTKFRLRVYHAEGITITNQDLCYEKEYSLSDLLYNVPSSHQGITVGVNNSPINIGNNIIFPLSPTNTVEITYSATINGKVVNNIFWKTINMYESVFFSSTINDLGLITENTERVLLTNFLTTNSVQGNIEFTGPGVQNLFGEYYFNPSIALKFPNLNNISVRVTNNGCIGDWHDTIFLVHPIVTNLTQPFISGEPTVEYDFIFPKSAVMLNLYDTTSPIRPFITRCAGDDFQLSVSPLNGITYEWESYFLNSLRQTGSGTTFTVDVPDNNEIIYGHNYNQSYNPTNLLQPGESLQNLGINLAVMPSLSFDSLITTDLPPLLMIRVRKKNILNEVSPWSDFFYAGVVKKPEFNNVAVCTDSSIVFQDISNSSDLYSSLFYDVNIFRSNKIDYNLDNVWDYGIGDTHNLTSVSKINYFKSVIVDSFKYIRRNIYTGQVHFESSPWEISNAVCHSQDKNQIYVRNPKFNLSSSSLDTLPYGTPVYLSLIDKQFFSPSNSITTWTWSDGSGTYTGENHWHYLNDLGDHILIVNVIDTFGCQTINYYPNWYVPGVLDVEELTFDNFVIYPNPASDYLQIKSPFVLQSEDIEVYDLVGKRQIINFDSSSNKIELENFSSGIYILNIKTNKGISSISFQIK